MRKKVIDFRTDKEKQVEKRRAAISARYKEIETAYPQMYKSRIFKQVAKEFGCSYYTVRTACKITGAYQPAADA